VSLGTALFLLKKDGEYALDKLQANKSHQHHGLEHKGFAAINPKVAPLEILETICATPFRNSKDEAWGHFALFYSALCPPAVAIDRKITSDQAQGSLDGLQPQYCVDLPPIDAFKDRIFSAKELVATLPDLVEDLRLLGVDSKLRWCKINYNIHLEHAVGADGSNPKHVKTHEDFKIVINGISPDQQKAYLGFLNSVSCPLTAKQVFSNHLLLTGKRTFNEGDDPRGFFLPDAVDDLHGRIFAILESQHYIAEVAAFHVLLFQFGMLARYYPEKWMSLIGHNMHFSEFLNALLTAAEKKLPLLFLDQMTDTKTINQA